jgi:hypothetical protein
MFLYNMAPHHTEILVVLQNTMQHTVWELTGDSDPERPYLDFVWECDRERTLWNHEKHKW